MSKTSFLFSKDTFSGLILSQISLLIVSIVFCISAIFDDAEFSLLSPITCTLYSSGNELNLANIEFTSSYYPKKLLLSLVKFQFLN